MVLLYSFSIYIMKPSYIEKKELEKEKQRKIMEGGISSSSSSSSSNWVYRECLRNHAANLGSYATDGCGEFTPSDMSPGSLQCAACGCHRNFHRKVTYLPPMSSARGGDPTETSSELMDYSGGGGEGERSGGKKRFRTKFTADQKEKMFGFAEKIGWTLQRKDLDDEIERFCRSVGVSRQVFKVWMHNHKNSSSSFSVSTAGKASPLTDQ